MSNQYAGLPDGYYFARQCDGAGCLNHGYVMTKKEGFVVGNLFQEQGFLLCASCAEKLRTGTHVLVKTPRIHPTVQELAGARQLYSATWKPSPPPRPAWYERFMDTYPLVKLVFWGGWTVTLEFKLPDFWIGLFFTKKEAWLCLLPCFPLHIKKES